MEPYKNFSVLVHKPDGTTNWVTKVMARTKWEAIDKVYTKLKDQQPDRSKYLILKPFIRAS